MEHDGWFFIGVFAFIFLIWAATGGPTHPLSFTGPTLALPGALGGGTYLSLPTTSGGIRDTNTTLPNNSYSGSGGAGGSTSTTTLSGVGFGTPSGYRGEISLSHYISGGGSSNPNNEYAVLSLPSNAPGPVTISGWTLQSEASGNTATIPGAADVPLSGIINGGAPVTLQPGQTAYIISGRSPIGASFRENKCIGYFAQFQHFTPSLPNSCPTPTSELQKNYPDYIRDNSCINYTNTLSRCQAVLSTPNTISGACTHLATTYLNYNGCVNEHANDSDFKSGTWQLYLGRTAAMWRSSHEVVKLLDENGQTVDAFSY